MTLEEFVREFQPGSMTGSALRIFLIREAQIDARDRKQTEGQIRKLDSGLRLFNRIKQERNGAFSKLIPRDLDWRELVFKQPKEQARWYLENCPEVGTLEYNLFKRLCKAFGVGGNEFYYWLRKLS